MKFPDTWEPITRIGREIHMLAPYYIAGDAFQFERTRDADGRPNWDCSSVVCEQCALLFANDLAYRPDESDNTFHFGAPREFSQRYVLPHWLRKPADVFRVDADGVHDVTWKAEINGVVIQHTFSRDAIFIATKLPGLRTEIEARRRAAIRKEESHPVDVHAL